jgi:hypothetical protein
LAEPFAARVNDALREQTRVNLTLALGPSNPACLKVASEMEPNSPWQETYLVYRAECYKAHRDPKRDEAASDLQRYRSNTQATFEALLDMDARR